LKEGSSLRDSLARLSPESLLWVTSLFCGFLGAFLLIAPHRFQTPSYEVLLVHALGWGTLALASGVGLLAVTVLRPGRWQGCVACFFVGLTLLALAGSFFQVGALSGGLIYSLLGLGTIAACLLPRGRPAEAGVGGDLFGLLMGLSATLVGALMAGAPALFTRFLPGPQQGYLLGFGLAFLLLGPPLVAVQLAPAAARRWSRPVHALAGITFLVFGFLVPLPRQSWTGVALYIGGGATIAVLPRVSRRLAALETSALRAQLALTLAIATSLALILATAVVTAQEERLAETQVTAAQRIEAGLVAQSVSDFIERNGARTSTLAVSAGRSPMTVEGQGDLLAVFQRLYSDVAALRTVSADGRVIATSGAALPPGPVLALARGAREENQVEISPIMAGERYYLLVGAPIPGEDGRNLGALVAAFDARLLGQRITRPGSYVSLADGFGRPIAAVSRLIEGEAVAPLPAHWDQTIRAGKTIERSEGVVGFAVIPRLGWVVAVERPRASALAGVRRGRDLAFGLLLLVIPLTVAAGIFASRRIARPLGDLSHAVDALTAGDLAAPVPAASGIAEVARLAAAFQEMRDRLAERTAESERLAAELRARADVLAEADRRKDEFLAMLAHELRNPLGAIANASYLLEQLGPAEPQVRPVAIIRRQVQHLVRMVDDLLDVSRITRGKVELRRQPLDLNEVLQHAAEGARPLAEARGQTLAVELPPEPLPLDGDATRLEQVLTNLLRNAVKLTDPQGHIEISARRQDGEAVVIVRDDGIGIAADLLPRIFDLFVQGEQGLDRTGAGLGIGLTLVRSLVEMHGGHVEARSEGPGKGSEFEVRLPLTPPAARGR
jgi:signal transduction histidine kinase